jgi:hypothetical protein
MPDEVRARFSMRATYVDATQDRAPTLAPTGTTTEVDALLAGLWSD